ncbi:MAG: 50S ribosomal protein L4 [archaeon]
MLVYNLQAQKVREISLPSQFSEAFHPNLIKRAVLTLQSNKRRRYGSYSRAGKDYSAMLSKRRRDYKNVYGRGIARTPRKSLWRRGSQFGFVGALAPNTVGGRRAHPPKSSKIYEKKLNIKERRKAIRSALSATFNKDLVKIRNHVIPEIFPLIIETSIESVKKTKELKKILENFGLKKELERVSIKKIRAGRGKSRNRKYRKKTGPLIIVSKKCDLQKSAPNIPGLDIVEIKNINTELLAPGCQAGRLIIISEEAIKLLEKEKLFM